MPGRDADLLLEEIRAAAARIEHYTSVHVLLDSSPFFARGRDLDRFSSRVTQLSVRFGRMARTSMVAHRGSRVRRPCAASSQQILRKVRVLFTEKNAPLTLP